MLKKLLVIALSIFLISSCAEDSSTSDDSSSSSSPELSLTVNNVQISSNIDSIEYIVKTNESGFGSNSLITNTLSDDSSSGFVYGFTSGDGIKPIFTPFDAGYATDIKKNGNKFIYNGDFSVSGGNSNNTGSTINCLIVFQNSDDASCILEKQDAVSSANAAFYGNKALVFISLKDEDTKQIYEYDLVSTFTKIENFKTNGSCAVTSECFGSDSSEYSVSGEVAKSYQSNDLVSFLINKDDNSKEMFLVRKVGSEYRMKKDAVTSDDVVEVNGESFYISNGNLRGGWDKLVTYNQSSNNRTISTGSLLVSNKDAYFSFFYQSDYVEHSNSIPAIFYLKDKRNDLPASYPDYTLEKIVCCKAKNNPSGTRDLVAEMKWMKVSGFGKYVLAYGEVASDYNGKNASDIIINKAIILIDGDNKTDDGSGNAVMSSIALYDHNNTSSKEDNKIDQLDFDTVTEIKNYKNGFKLTGTKSSSSKTVYYNPYTNAIETPTGDDANTFVIKQRL